MFPFVTGKKTLLWWLLLYSQYEVIKYLIAAGREIQGQPEDWVNGYSSQNMIETAHLIRRYWDHPEETMHQVRVELRFSEEFAAEVFALVVFLCDGLLEIKDSIMTGAARFFRMAQSLPMELQMVLCRRVVGSPADNIPGNHRELAFRHVAQKTLSL